MENAIESKSIIMTVNRCYSTIGHAVFKTLKTAWPIVQL